MLDVPVGELVVAQVHVPEIQGAELEDLREGHRDFPADLIVLDVQSVEVSVLLNELDCNRARRVS